MAVDAGTRPDGYALRLALGSVFAFAALVLFVVWFLFREGSGQDAFAARNVPVAATVESLKELSAEVGHPIYWIGARPRYTYELTHTSEGQIYVRYLPPKVPVGATRTDLLTIGTYPQPNALATLRLAGWRARARAIPIGDGGFAVVDRRRPTNVYLAYPRSDLQIEVYHPSPRRAQMLALSGRVRPVT